MTNDRTDAHDDLLTRRSLLVRAGCVFGGASALPLLAACGGGNGNSGNAASGTAAGAGTTVLPHDPSKIGGRLNFLGWEGYEDKAAIGPWLKDNGVSMNKSYISSDDDVIAKLRAGGVGKFDVVTINSGYLPALIKFDLIQPIPLEGIPNFDQLIPYFQQVMQEPLIEGIKAPDGSVYGVPFIWSPYSMQYRADMVEPPESWLDFKDPKYKGKIVLQDSVFNVWIWGLAMGLWGTDLRAAKKDLAPVRDELIKTKENVRVFSSSYSDTTDLLVRGDVAMTGPAWDAIIGFAREKGVEVASWIPPKDGTVTWVDCHALAKDAPDRDNAIGYINGVVDRVAQSHYAETLLSGIVNETAVPLLSGQLKGAYPYDALDTYFEKAPIHELPPLESNQYATADDFFDTWTAVKDA